jgi:uncharacterized membrane protein YeaQ/YmgE (transglycosylase-associated protein family)
MLTLSGPALMLLVVIAAICGGIGKAIAGGTRGSLITSIALGFFGALLGAWMARQLRLPEPFLLRVDGSAFPILWSVIGAAVLVAVVHFLTRPRPIVRL